MKSIRVLIVDDSALVRQLLTQIINAQPDMEVVGSAADPYQARERIKQLNPDVLTLDVEMPKMDGIKFLEHLMRLRPMPVVMVSSLTERGADVTLQALELGAVDFVSKPQTDLVGTLGDYSEEIAGKVRAAARARVGKPPLQGQRPSVTPKYTADAVIEARAAPRRFRTTDRMIAVGASTGGTEAIKTFLMALPADAPAIVITQHIPAAFSAPFAARMNQASALSVCEAADGQQILAGHAYIAPGDQHLLVEQDGARYVCRLSAGPPVNRHRPSVDVMFRSAAQNVGANAVGVLLTGMGEDGARGLKEMQEAGAPTLAQDERSSVVWGMPGAAVRLGAADAVVALDGIAQMALQLCAQRQPGSARAQRA
ncbi:MAG: chemotaxis response regulator protein-glutamate methylesterase [Nitrococcus sp.]|nr:chemotaxis response regulator protein-glutamate methylesterase [Nitrococcus sp.]